MKKNATVMVFASHKCRSRAQLLSKGFGGMGSAFSYVSHFLLFSPRCGSKSNHSFLFSLIFSLRFVNGTKIEGNPANYVVWRGSFDTQRLLHGPGLKISYFNGHSSKYSLSLSEFSQNIIIEVLDTPATFAMA